MVLLEIFIKKLLKLFKDIKYWFILTFDKSVFTILLSDNYFNKGDIVISENGVKLEVLKVKDKIIYIKTI